MRNINQPPWYANIVDSVLQKGPRSHVKQWWAYSLQAVVDSWTRIPGTYHHALRKASKPRPWWRFKTTCSPHSHHNKEYSQGKQGLNSVALSGLLWHVNCTVCVSQQMLYTNIDSLSKQWLLGCLWDYATYMKCLGCRCPDCDLMHMLCLVVENPQKTVVQFNSTLSS